MVAVLEIPWEEASAPDFKTTRRVWREAISEVVAKAPPPEFTRYKV